MKKVVKKEVIKKVKKAIKPVEEIIDPRAAYNCEACKGSGLIGDQLGLHKVCETCKGTGKV